MDFNPASPMYLITRGATVNKRKMANATAIIANTIIAFCSHNFASMDMFIKSEIDKRQIDENTKEILIINEPMNTVLDELLTTETVEQSTIIQEEEKLVIHKDTPVIDNEFLDTESIYEESKTNKPIDIKKPNKIGYAGGISK